MDRTVYAGEIFHNFNAIYIRDIHVSMTFALGNFCHQVIIVQKLEKKKCM